MPNAVIEVPPQLPRRFPAPIAFIGEAPGIEETQKLQPFVGTSGRLFNSLLRTANLDREDFLVTNVFNQKLPDNDVKNWCMTMTEARGTEGGMALPPIGDRGFLRMEHRHHLTRLQQELEEWQPRVIVPLGGSALWALTGDSRITAHRGAVRAATMLVPGAKLVPTFHPMAVQHQWKFFAIVVGDILRASIEAAKGPHIILPRRELLLEPTLDDIEAYLPRLLRSSSLSVDIETGWGQITCIGFAPDAEHSINIPFLDKRRPDRNYWPTADHEAMAWGFVRRVLEAPVPKLGQNFGGYDAYWLLRKMHIGPRNFRADTRLLHHALYPELAKTLEFMASAYGTQGAWKQWGRAAQRTKRDD